MRICVVFVVLQVVYPCHEPASRYHADRPMSLMTTSAQPAHHHHHLQPQLPYRYDPSNGTAVAGGVPSNSSSSQGNAAQQSALQPVDLSSRSCRNSTTNSRLATATSTTAATGAVSTSRRRQGSDQSASSAHTSADASAARVRKPAAKRQKSSSSRRDSHGQCACSMYNFTRPLTSARPHTSRTSSACECN